MEMNSSTQRSADHQVNVLHSLENWNAGTQQNSQEPSLHRQMAEGKTWADWCQGLKVFIWNPDKREFLGRNGKSWALISLFYFLLYSFLTGMFALCIYGLLLTINPYVPTYRDRVFPPGVTIRPHVADFHFSFSASESSTWSSYAETLNTFLEAYNDDIQIVNNIECTPGQYFIQAGDEKEEKKACHFRRSQLKNCSGIEDPTFGFSEGKPCFLLKMNRIVGYKAGSGVPIYVTCEVPRGNHTHLGSVNFYPTNEYDLMYYPF